jgi:hypothetical protein
VKPPDGILRNDPIDPAAHHLVAFASDDLEPLPVDFELTAPIGFDGP